ncbi:UNVERIFIED_CONTAM: ATP-binding protein, partial [Prevotella sp. 15_C9]
VKMYPLSFSEYMSAYSGTIQAGFNEYMLYGGLPQILSYTTEEQKVRFLKTLFDETYIKDIKERYDIRKDDDLEELIN